MRIAVGCDHRGLELKQYIITLVSDTVHSIEDFGCYGPEPVDYPDIARKVAMVVARGGFDHGVLICNTGIGMSIAANKVKGIRAALCFNSTDSRCARQHNDANILCLGAERGKEQVPGIIETYLKSEFEGGRHLRRVDKITAIERGLEMG